MLRTLISLFSFSTLGVVCVGQSYATADQLLNDLACGSCHEGIDVQSDIRKKAPDLTAAGIRYSPDYIYSFVRYPVRIRRHIGVSRMPSFRLDEREGLALALYLGELRPAGAATPGFPVQRSFEAVRSAHPDVTAELGESLFRALNCVACHKHPSLEEWEATNAPDLGFEGARARFEWLTEFLRVPRPVRPHGFYPGSGSRHPDFLLTLAEVDTLAAFLTSRRQGFEYPSRLVETEETTLSPALIDRLLQFFGPEFQFSRDKAARLLADKLPCLGCHRLGDDGGRIGPDMSSLNTRLSRGFLRQIVGEPASVVPQVVMPKVPMPQLTFDLIESYLNQQQLQRDSVPYLSLIDNPPLLHQDLENGQRLYMKHCAACHGTTGNADGYNAEYLPKPPTAHSDSAYMSTRPDDTLFDGIYAGGYILNKSQRMPPWGFTLRRDEIRQLVAYIRQLCRCEGPAWSRPVR